MKTFHLLTLLSLSFLVFADPAIRSLVDTPSSADPSLSQVISNIYRSAFKLLHEAATTKPLGQPQPATTKTRAYLSKTKDISNIAKCVS